MATTAQADCPLGLKALDCKRVLVCSGVNRPGPRIARLLAVAFDPVLAFTAFCTFGGAVSLPGILEPKLTDAHDAAPLGPLELAAGLMIRAQGIPATRQARTDRRAAALLWTARVPMTAVAVVEMLSPRRARRALSRYRLPLGRSAARRPDGRGS